MKTLLQNLKEQIFSKAQRRSRFFSLKVERTLRNRRKLLISLTFIAVVSLAGVYIADNIVIASGQSLDKKFFLKVDGDIKMGDYVVVYIPEDPIVKDKKLSKKVVCQGGQTLKIVEDDYFCDDTYIGKAVKQTKDGVPVEPYNPCVLQETMHSPFDFYKIKAGTCIYKIPDGYYFVAGTHPRSYDSRYFGLVSKKEIITKIEPLF